MISNRLLIIVPKESLDVGLPSLPRDDLKPSHHLHQSRLHLYLQLYLHLHLHLKL